MNYLPPAFMQVKSLKLPGDIKMRMKQAHVIELSESIAKRTGKRPIHLPTIEYPSKELIAGGDRIAAQLLLGYRSIWVQPVSQLTPQERRDIQRDENVHRRVVDRDALIGERVAERAAEIEAARGEAPPDLFPPGRPKTPVGVAREQVAREIGTTVDAVKQAEIRNKSHVTTPRQQNDSNDLQGVSIDHTAQVPEIINDSPSCVETWDLPLVSDAEMDAVRSYQGAIDAADRFLRRAQAALSGIDGGPFAALAQRLGAKVHEAAHAVRSARPAAVCPYCKRVPGLQCRGCDDVGFVAEDAMLGVSDELKLGGDRAMVATPAGLVPYAKARGTAPDLNSGDDASPKIPDGRFDGDPDDGLEPAALFDEELPSPSELIGGAS